MDEYERLLEEMQELKMLRGKKATQQTSHSGYQYYRHTTSKDAVLAYSHYSDPAFDGRGACIFGNDEKNLQWDYADRLQQWDWDKSDRCWKEATEKHGNARTARRIETYLSLYHERPVDLKCIITGTQQFNGYPWYAYGYIFTDKGEQA